MTPYLAARPDVTVGVRARTERRRLRAARRACSRVRVTARGTLDAATPRARHASRRSVTTGVFDTVVYINCLEHIRDEEVELQRRRRAPRRARRPPRHLLAGARVLYGELDRVSGHWRRYSAPSMLAAVEDAGLRSVHARYVDLLSIAPYWLSNRVLGRTRSATCRPTSTTATTSGRPGLLHRASARRSARACCASPSLPASPVRPEGRTPPFSRGSLPTSAVRSPQAPAGAAMDALRGITRRANDHCNDGWAGIRAHR